MPKVKHKYEVGDTLTWWGDQTYTITEIKIGSYKLKHRFSSYHEWNDQEYIEIANVTVHKPSKLERALK